MTCGKTLSNGSVTGKEGPDMVALKVRLCANTKNLGLRIVQAPTPICKLVKRHAGTIQTSKWKMTMTGLKDPVTWILVFPPAVVRTL